MDDVEGVQFFATFLYARLVRLGDERPSSEKPSSGLRLVSPAADGAGLPGDAPDQDTDGPGAEPTDDRQFRPTAMQMVSAHVIEALRSVEGLMAKHGDDPEALQPLGELHASLFRTAITIGQVLKESTLSTFTV